MMSPEEFAAKMLECEKNPDIEGGHARADDLMCSLLESLGYKEGIRVFTRMDKWYA